MTDSVEIPLDQPKPAEEPEEEPEPEPEPEVEEVEPGCEKILDLNFSEI